jgi:hypothetical protein
MDRHSSLESVSGGPLVFFSGPAEHNEGDKKKHDIIRLHSQNFGHLGLFIPFSATIHPFASPNPDPE